MSERVQEGWGWDHAEVRELVLELKRVGARMALDERMLAELRFSRAAATADLIVTWLRRLAFARGEDLQVPRTWWDHLRHELYRRHPWLQRLFGEPEYQTWQAQLLIPDWILDHPITHRYTVVPTFSLVRCPQRERRQEAALRREVARDERRESERGR